MIALEQDESLPGPQCMTSMRELLGKVESSYGAFVPPTNPPAIKIGATSERAGKDSRFLVTRVRPDAGGSALVGGAEHQFSNGAIHVNMNASTYESVVTLQKTQDCLISVLFSSR
jgi:hypothetical protein